MGIVGTAITIGLLLAQGSSVSGGPSQDAGAIGAVVTAYFEAMSGPSGTRDWDRLRRLTLPSARFNAMGITAQGGLMFHPQSLDEYVHHMGEYIARRGFYQRAFECRSDAYALIAQVFCTYESRNEPEGRRIDQGKIGFQLIMDEGRWRIASVIWNSDTQRYPLPRYPGAM